MTNVPELDKMHRDLEKLKRIVQGEPDEGRKGLNRVVHDLSDELERQLDDKTEGTAAYRIRQLEKRNEELAIRDSERKWILRGILGLLAFLGISGGAVVGNILTTLQQLAQRSSP